MQESPSNGGFDARTNSSISTASTSSQPLLVAVGTAAPLPDHDPFSQHRRNIQSTVDDPLFELMIPDVEVINDTGPRSAPAAEDFPIGSFARLASVLVCRDILGEAMPDWWHHLILEGVDLRIERHCDEYALVAGSVSTQAWGLEPRDETDVVAFQVMVHRACMLAPRISHGNGSRYQTPTAIAASLRLVPSSGALATSSVMPNLSATLTPSDVDLKLAVEQGNAKLKEGNCAQAIEYYTMAIQLAEGNVAHTGSKLHIRALSNRSAAFFKLWDFDRALQDGERCAVLDRKSIVGYIRAGTASRGKKQFDLADNWFRKALQIDTQSQDRIQAYIEANAIAQALHDSVSRVAKFIDVSVDPSRISVIAKKKFENKERIFTELPWAAVSLEPPNAACPTCNHCHMQLWDRDMVGRALHAACLDLSDSAKTQAAQMLLGFTGCQKQTECRHKCGAHYCGKRCADLAYDEYHWAECSAHGKWKTCMNFIDRLMTADSTFAKVLHPYAIRLAIRVLAIFFVKKGDRSGGDATAFLQRMLTRRTGILFNELPPNQVEIVNRVRDALVPHLTADQVRVVVDDGALLSITEHVMHCDTKFNVSILHRAQEAVDIHRGWLHDGPPADASTFAVLAELDAAYRAAIEQNQIRCSGLFRLVCCIQMAGEPHVYSFSELDTTSLGASLLRAASPSPGDHDGSGSSNSGRPGNCHLVVQTASAMHGITVQASTAVSRHQCLVLSDPNAMSGTRNSKRTSTSSVGRIRKSSSPLDGSRLAAVAVPQ